MAIGSSLVEHVWRGWCHRSQRADSVSLPLANVLLIVTGFSLYHASTDRGRPTIRIIHSVVRLVGLPIFLWHWLGAKRLWRRLQSSA